MWPGLVGKGADAEPFIPLETMLDLTAQAEVDGVHFDGVDLFLSSPHTSIDSTDDELKHLADSIARRQLVVGSVVAPVWPPTGGGSAMGSEQERKNFLTQVRKACAIAGKLRDLGIRRYGVVRIDSAASPADWAKDPAANTKRIAQTFSRGRDHCRRSWRAPRRRGRNLLGRNAQLEADGRAAGDGGPSEDARLSSGHGALSAVHAGLQRAGRSVVAGEFRLVATGCIDGSPSETDACFAALDHRFSCRAERRNRKRLRFAR